MNKRIYLSSPHMGTSEQHYVQEAFDTNWIAPLGANVDAFEQSISDFLGEGNHVAALSSGTGALHLGLVLLGVGPGDEVICQSMTFSASANPITYLGASPVFIDSEPNTWNLDPEVLESAILDRISRGKKPKAIIAVHLYGMPFDVDGVLDVAGKYGIPVLEDAAESLGSTYKGRNCGTFGDVSILSFNGNKIITTSGGGALVSRSKELRDKAVFLSTQARENAPHYEHKEIGYNYRMSNVLAGIGRGQMEVLEDRVNARRANQRFYKEFFRDTEDITVFEEPGPDYYSNHWLTCILFRENSRYTPLDLRTELEKVNIESRPLWKPMHLQPVYNDAPFYGADVAKNLFMRGLCLPSGSNLTPEDLGRIGETLAQFT